MRTLYIDVYFLINFTIDILSLYFAALFAKIPTSSFRLVISSLLGALSAVIIVLLPEILLIKVLLALFSLLLIGYITPKPIMMRRKIKFVFSFLVFEALVGGGVSFLWGILDKYLSTFFASSMGGAANRKLLFLSIIVLLSIGVFKMFVSVFSSSHSEENVEVEITFQGKTTVVSAFVDSGNLAIDPMDMSPIMLIKKECAKTFLPKNIIELSQIDSLDYGVKKRIRLIPVSRGGCTHVLVGVKADVVRIIRKDQREEIKVTIAIDKEGGSFGGFEALMPSAVLSDALS